MIVLIGGGSRSGKSRYALEYARLLGEPLVFLATAQTLDNEMTTRALAHREERGTAFTTIEEPLEVANAIRSTSKSTKAIVVDCLTLWLSNLMFADRDIRAEAAALFDAASVHPGSVLLVTNEVGCGIVPENALARKFRDEAGWLNQQAAQAATEVWWMVFGCPLRVK